MSRTDFEPMDRRLKWGLLALSLATLILLVVMALRENVYPEWRRFRQRYASILKENATDERGKAIAEQFVVRVVQNYVPELHVADRCITCHAGVDNPHMKDQPQPFTTHPGKLLDFHDPNKYGCTVCHHGQGRATTTDEAHGRTPYWEYPLLDKPYITGTCSKCHPEADLLGSAGLIARSTGVEDEVLALGRRIFHRDGCLGCHSLHGKGGAVLGTDLTGEGDKTRHDFDFSLLLHRDRESPKNVIHWQREHFLDPAEVSSGTLMPNMGYSEEDAVALTAYVLSFRGPVTAAACRAPARRQTPPAPSGRNLYALYCSACHGANGEMSESPGIRTPTLNNRDSLAVASDDYYRFIIEQGRTDSNMPAWNEDAGNLSREEIDRIVAFIRRWESEPPALRDVSERGGDPRRGRAYYQGNCANCHGRKGEGGVGNALHSLTFLAVASDEFLAKTIIEGRPGTAMASWKHLPSQAVGDVLAYMRCWQPERTDFQTVTATLESETPENLARLGKRVFRANCAACHGAIGQGGIGLVLNSDDLLSIVDDRYLYTQIVEGRPSTAMPAWHHLSAPQVAGLIAHLRSWQSGERREPPRPPMTGDYALGKVLFDVSCMRCHGERARGGVGPQLANPVLLRNISDAIIYHWISRGRSGTAMKGFLDVEQGPTRLTREQITHVIAYLRHEGSRDVRPIRRTGVGNPHLGGQLFHGSCASCHGNDGEGASGPQLGNPSFLESASDGFLAATMVLGRTDTPMRSMVHGQEGLGQIHPDNIQDIIAYLRLWDYGATWRKTRPVAEMSRRAIGSGKQLFSRFCSGCHGPNGRGDREGKAYYAPALNNPEFLQAADDGFLLATVARGRSNTPMRPFGRGTGGIAPLQEGQIADIVSFVRTWQQDSSPAVGRGQRQEEK